MRNPPRNFNFFFSKQCGSIKARSNGFEEDVHNVVLLIVLKWERFVVMGGLRAGCL